MVKMKKPRKRRAMTASWEGPYQFIGHLDRKGNLDFEEGSLLHIVPFCEGPNEKPEGFAKQKQLAIFAMRHALQLVVHHPLLIYNVPLIIAALLRHI